jgi:hypothetical protein
MNSNKHKFKGFAFIMHNASSQFSYLSRTLVLTRHVLIPCFFESVIRVCSIGAFRFHIRAAGHSLTEVMHMYIS